MFGINWSNPETLWLNLTNLGLGLCVIACLGVFAFGIVQEVREKVRQRATMAGMDSAAAGLVRGQFSPHSLHTPELGLTMADGGEPVEKPANAAVPPKQ